MDLHFENNGKHAIQAYDQHGVQVDNQRYEETLLLNATQLISMLSLKHLLDLTPAMILDTLESRPTILIIGHHLSNIYFAPSQLHEFIQQRIGVECMSFAAACRTYNILLSDERSVALLLLI